MDLDVAGHGADHERVALARNALQFRQVLEFDERGRRGETQLHGRQQRLAAGKRLRLSLLEVGDRGGERLRALVLKSVHGDISERGSAETAHRPARANHSAARFTGAFCAARHTTCGVAGMVTSSCPTASLIALMTAGRRGDGARLAAALDAERVRRTGGHDRVDLERRQVVGARHAVVHVARGQQLAVRVVDAPPSISAWPMPWATPPWTWPSTIIGLMSLPKSSTAV